MVMNPLGIILFWGGAFGLASVGRTYVRRFDGIHFLWLMALAFFAEIFTLVLAVAIFK